SQRNVRVLLAEVADFDFEARQVHLTDAVAMDTVSNPVSYDTLIVAAGSSYSYFGHEDWREFAAEVKTLESAIAVRAEILRAFEAAEMLENSEARQAHLTFVVVGAGPTGVEMSGQIAEMARGTLGNNLRSIDAGTARLLIVGALDRVLTSFPHSLSRKAQRSLEGLGVTVRITRTVVGIDHDSVTLSGPDDATERIEAKPVIWPAGTP